MRMADNLTSRQRSYCMSRVKSRDTDIETILRSALHKRGLRFRKHVRALPGCPDIVFMSIKCAVFVDGDFWHGYRFPAWIHRVSPFWQEKIGINRIRDRRNQQKLRRIGWKVIRLWQHQVKQDLAACVRRIDSAVVAQRMIQMSPKNKSRRVRRRSRA